MTADTRAAQGTGAYADVAPPRHYAEIFELLGGGLRDAGGNPALFDPAPLMRHKETT